ncbi:MAG: hypothetical protein RLZZ230_710 [Candidatus Parcubacteria bacterium]|jgi:hypothetical protein
MKFVISLLFLIVAVAVGAWWFIGSDSVVTPNQPEACTQEAMLCPDGSAVGRTGPNCAFAPCPKSVTPVVPEDILSRIAEKSNLIRLDYPQPLETLTSPITVTGEARGNWFFEASFPIVVTDWDGRIIGEGQATAQNDWMTEDFVPFVATIEYNLPADAYAKNGMLILKRDNPSGLPENDDALEIPVLFK